MLEDAKNLVQWFGGAVGLALCSLLLGPLAGLWPAALALMLVAVLWGLARWSRLYRLERRYRDSCVAFSGPDDHR